MAWRGKVDFQILKFQSVRLEWEPDRQRSRASASSTPTPLPALVCRLPLDSSGPVVLTLISHRFWL